MQIYANLNQGFQAKNIVQLVQTNYKYFLMVDFALVEKEPCSGKGMVKKTLRNKTVENNI